MRLLVSRPSPRNAPNSSTGPFDETTGHDATPWETQPAPSEIDAPTTIADELTSEAPRAATGGRLRAIVHRVSCIQSDTSLKLKSDILPIRLNQTATKPTGAAKAINLKSAVLPTLLPEQTTDDIVATVISQPLRAVDQGIFSLGLIRQDIYPRDLSKDQGTSGRSKIPEASFDSTQRAITEAFSKIESR